MKISREVLNKLITNSNQQNKYHNEKTIVEGKKFDSKKEAKRYTQLKLLEKYNMITDLKRQVKFELQPKYELNGIKVRAIYYIADFTYRDKGKLIVEDVKGVRTDVYKLKKKLFEYKYGISIKEI